MFSANQRARLAAREIACALRGGLLAGLFLIGVSSAVGAQGLFQPATSSEMRGVPRQTESAGPAHLRNRLVRLESAALARHVVPVDADNAPNRLQRAQRLDGVVDMQLFPDITVTVRRSGLEAPEDGGFIWTGEISGPRSGWATLVISNNQITGQVHVGTRLFKIEPVSGAVHRIIEIDPNRLPKDLHPPELPPHLQRKGEPAPPQPATRVTLTTITVLVAYTTAAKNAAGSITQIVNEIKLAIAMTNTAYKNSGVNARLKLVKTMQVNNYNEAYMGGNTSLTAYSGVLCDLTDFKCGTFGWIPPVNNTKTAAFNAVRSARNTVKADLVALIRKLGAACGIAWVPRTFPRPDLGFSVTSRECIAGNTFAHETGHNQGLNHDRYVEPKAPNSQYNYGYVDVVGRFRDIMSYPDKCSKAGVNCTRIPYFSTPRKKFNGRPIGIAKDKPGAADGTRRLNETRTFTSKNR